MTIEFGMVTIWPDKFELKHYERRRKEKAGGHCCTGLR